MNPNMMSLDVIENAKNENRKKTGAGHGAMGFHEDHPWD